MKTEVKVICSGPPNGWCDQMRRYLNDDPDKLTREDVARGLASVETGRCAWCGGKIRKP